MPAIPSLTQPLSDGRLALRPTVARDIPEILIAYQDDPLLHVRMCRPRPPSGAELGRELEDAERDRAGGIRFSLTLVEPPADACCGILTLHTIDWEQRRAEVGLWVAPSLRGRGLGRGALRLMTPWLFEACGLKRLQLLTEPDNDPMLRAAQAAGFVREGLLHRYRYGRDMVSFSLLPRDLESRTGSPAADHQVPERAR